MAPSLRRLGEIVQAAFQILANKSNGMPARELLAELAASMKLTPFEAEDYPKHPGTRRFEKITRFATIAPVKAGWLRRHALYSLFAARVNCSGSERLDAAVTVEGLRAFMALLGNSDLGIFVSIGGFTRSAADEARAQESRKITLIDSDRLIELWVEHYDKLDESGKRHLPLKAVHYLAAGE